MPAASSPALLTLHALRLLGHGDEAAIARRFGLDRDEVAELLLDDEAFGWVTRVAFGSSGTWTLTPAGRAAEERMLAHELVATGAGNAVARARTAFIPLDVRFQAACSHWHIRPRPGQPLAANDHANYVWDSRVTDEFIRLGREFAPIAADLAAHLARFDRYAGRYDAAVRHVGRGETRWVDAVEVDSCRSVWLEFHEDLLSTLGIEHGEERC